MKIPCQENPLAICFHVSHFGGIFNHPLRLHHSAARNTEKINKNIYRDIVQTSAHESNEPRARDVRSSDLIIKKLFPIS